MKKSTLLLILFPLYCLSQNVGIGTTSPNQSAALHVESSNKGVLIPKLALLSLSSNFPVSSPEVGLLVYNTTVNSQLENGFYYWTGTSWERLASAATGAVPKNGIIEFESKQNVPGYTYIGSELAEYFLKIATGFGAWVALPSFPYSNNVKEPSSAFYNNRFFVWSGEDNSYANYEQTGAYYDVGTNTWTQMSVTNAPQGRHNNVTVVDEANGRMFVWGGVIGKTGAGTTPVVSASGSSYNLALNNGWTTMAASPLTARMKHAGVWAPGKMIVWGGNDGNGNAFANGAVYNYPANTWSSMAASPLAARWGHSAIWTGSKMLIWGGTNGSTIFNDGAAYDPATNTWSGIANMTLFNPSFGHTAVWTGTEMITFGGVNSFGTTNACFKYNVSTNSWTSPAPSPGASSSALSVERHRALWTGTEMVIIGGVNSSNTINGIREIRAYNPVTDTWSMYNSLPSGKIAPAVAWTGSQVLIQGGSWNNNTGYRFDPGSGTAQDIEVSQNRFFYKYKKN